MGQDLARIMVFDFDGTLIDGSIATIIAKELEKISGKEKWVKFWDSQTLFNILSYDEAIERLSDIFTDAMRDISASDLDQAISSIRPNLRWKDGFAELHKWLASNGFKTYIISASPQLFIAKVIEGIKVDGIFGLNITISDNFFNGKHLGAMTCKMKATIISNQILTTEAHSFGITDSHHDIAAFKHISTIYLLNTQDPKYYSKNILAVNTLEEVQRNLGQFDFHLEM